MNIKYFVKQNNIRRVDKMSYNGWKNRQTWNVMLWISNDESLYRAAVRFMNERTRRAPYKQFIEEMGMAGDRTPDNIAWISTRLDYAALNAAMREFAE